MKYIEEITCTPWNADNSQGVTALIHRGEISPEKAVKAASEEPGWDSWDWLLDGWLSPSDDDKDYFWKVEILVQDDDEDMPDYNSPLAESSTWESWVKEYWGITD